MARKSPIRVTPEVFNKVHTLKDSGVFTNIQIAEIVGISPATTSYICRAKSLEEYKAMLNTSTQMQRARAAQNESTRILLEKNLEAEKTGNSFQEAQLDRIIELLIEQNKILKQIATVWDIKEPATEYDYTKAPF